jgi:hypothetical protein
MFVLGLFNVSRDSIATGCRLNDRGVGVRVLVGSGIFSQVIHTGFEVHLTYPCVPAHLPPGVKRSGREADYSPPSSAEVKKMWIYTSTPTYVKHRDNFTLRTECKMENLLWTGASFLNNGFIIRQRQPPPIRENILHSNKFVFLCILYKVTRILDATRNKWSVKAVRTEHLMMADSDRNI